MKHQEGVPHYGIDWTGPLSEDGDEDCIAVPVTNCPLSSRDFNELQHIVNPLDLSSDCGIDIYLATMEFVRIRTICCLNESCNYINFLLHDL